MYTKDLKIQINRVDFLNKIRKIAKKNTLDYFVFDTLKISESNSNFYSTNTLNNRKSKEFKKILSRYIK